MGKRAATSGRNKSKSPRDRKPPRKQIEPLEGRLLMSTTPPVVTVNWGGYSTKAVQGQYVTEVLDKSLFANLITKEGFTDVKSLGQGFYQFASKLPANTLRVLGNAVPKTLVTIEPNRELTLASSVPDDPMFSQQWGLDNTGQLEPYDYNLDGVVTPYNYEVDPAGTVATDFPSPTYPNENYYGLSGDDVDATQAWDITTGSKNVVVALLDSGIDLNQPDLVNNIWTNPLDTAANGYNGDGYPGDIHGYNLVANTDDVTDHVGHGTIDAGIIGASGNNGVGVTGVNWNVSLLPVKVSEDGSLTTASEVSGLNYITTLRDDGINIVAANESFAGNDFPDVILENNATALAGKAGILVVAAAGNNSQNVDRNFTTPAHFSLSSSNVITVAAIDDQGQLAKFSNFGAESVNIAAPGIDIYNTTPTYAVSENPTAPESMYDYPQLTENYGYSSGTSQATPFVTGIIALEAAANPAASPQQLKTALLNGVTYDPALAAANGNPALVSTSGIANAYKAVLNIRDPYVGSDTNRQGSWSPVYGNKGAYVVGESTSFPTFVSATLGGGSPVILADSTKNPVALDRVSVPSDRISAYEASQSVETIDLAFNDGQSHQVELYMADLDHKKRSQYVEVIDDATGQTLDANEVSNFTKGDYLIWSLQGSVTIKLTATAGPSAVYSGIFFDTPSTKPTTLLGTDTTTKGINWRNQYGSQGAVVAGDTSQLPSYVSSFNTSGASVTVINAGTNATSALQKIDNVGTGIEAYYGTTTSEDFDLTTTDGLLHNVTFYVADYKNKHRSEEFEVIDPTTGNILATQNVYSFAAGKFVSFGVTGTVIFRVVDTGPAGTDAAVSGVFFDAPFGENASFIGTDTTTAGNWKSTLYGTSGAYIVGDNFPGIDDTFNSQIVTTGATRQVIAVPSSNKAALFKTEATNSNVRVAAYLQTTTSMTLDINPGDLNQHQLALYFADYDKYNRTESVTIYNATTNLVLSHQVITNFRKGKYLIFDIAGPVLVTINSGTFPNAVLSGVFLD